MDNIYKLLTNTITNLLTAYWEGHIPYQSSQEGFHHVRNTNHALEIIKVALQDSKFTNHGIYLTYINIRNAFGSIDHAQYLAIKEDLRYPQVVEELVGNIQSNSTTSFKGPFLAPPPLCSHQLEFLVHFLIGSAIWGLLKRALAIYAQDDCICSSKFRYIHLKEAIPFQKMGRFQRYHPSNRRVHTIQFSLPTKWLAFCAIDSPNQFIAHQLWKSLRWNLFIVFLEPLATIPTTRLLGYVFQMYNFVEGTFIDRSRGANMNYL